MRLPWPRRWRRKPAYVAKHRPGSWAEVALPPREAAVPVEVASGASAPVAAQPVPVQPSVETTPAAVASTVVLTSGPAVRLGFSDGSSLLLDDTSDQAAALRNIATSLAFKNEPVEDR